MSTAWWRTTTPSPWNAPPRKSESGNARVSRIDSREKERAKDKILNYYHSALGNSILPKIELWNIKINFKK